jgi:hypothetical protein
LRLKSCSSGWLHWRQDSHERTKPADKIGKADRYRYSKADITRVPVDIGESKEAALASALSKQGLDKEALSVILVTGSEIGCHTEVYKSGRDAALTAFIGQIINSMPPSLGSPAFAAGWKHEKSAYDKVMHPPWL